MTAAGRKYKGVAPAPHWGDSGPRSSGARSKTPASTPNPYPSSLPPTGGYTVQSSTGARERRRMGSSRTAMFRTHTSCGEESWAAAPDPECPCDDHLGVRGRRSRS